MAGSRREFLGKMLAAPLVVAPHSSISRAIDFFSADVLSARLAADPLRPQFHLLPAKNWMNDPNGPIFWKGIYHMFYQYNPGAAVWGDMHWAHAVSLDMIHWRHLQIALTPTPGWADADGCFTGSAVDDQGKATIIYTGVKSAMPEMATLRDGNHNYREVQCLATSVDSQLRMWKKWSTPIIEPPKDPLLTGFRDPFLWQDGDVWYLGVASGLEKVGGRVLLYRSKDLRNWDYLHPLASGKWTEREGSNPVDSGEMWECPDFFALDGKHVLLYSTAGKVVWESGELDSKELVFHPQRSGVLDHGAYYAQKTQLDAQGNRILWGWITEKRPEAEYRAAGWAGCMALPRILSLSKDGDLEMRFVPQLSTLVVRAYQTPATLESASPDAVARILRSASLENVAARARWNFVAPSGEFTLQDDSGPWVSMRLEPMASATAKLSVNGKAIEIPAAANKRLAMDLIVDGSVAELICNDKHAVTSRIYRKPNGALKIGAGPAPSTQIDGLSVWQLGAISKDRLTT